MGFYTAGDRIKSWGGTGAFWGGIWGLLFAPAVFLLPGLGVVAMAGPLVAALVGALEGAVVVGGLSALGAALTEIGVPKDQVIKYEAALKVDKYLLVVHGNAADQARARTVLADAKISVPAWAAGAGRRPHWWRSASIGSICAAHRAGSALARDALGPSCDSSPLRRPWRRGPQGTSTAAPSKRPARRSASARLASRKG